MCIALCVTLFPSVWQFSPLFPQNYFFPWCTSLPHVFWQRQRERAVQCFLVKTLLGVGKNVWVVCWTTLGVCCIAPGSVDVWMCGSVDVWQAVWAMCPISAETGQWSRKVTRWREDTSSNQPTNWCCWIFFCAFFCRWHHNVYETVITDDRCSNAFLGRLPNWSQAMMLSSRLSKFS